MKRVTLLLVMIVMTSSVFGKTYYLKDGTTLDGKIVQKSDTTVIIEDERGNSHVISVSDLKDEIISKNQNSSVDNSKPTVIHGSVGIDLGPVVQFAILQGAGIGFGVELGGTFCSLYLRYAIGSIYGGLGSMSVPGAELRFYPGSENLSGFWFGPFVQFGIVEIKVGKTTASGTAGLFGGYVGYKGVFGKNGGLFLDPYLGIYISPGSSTSAIGLDYGLKIGYAF